MEKDKDKNIILYMLVVNDKLGPASAHLDISCLAYNIRKNYQGRDKKRYRNYLVYVGGESKVETSFSTFRIFALFVKWEKTKGKDKDWDQLQHLWTSKQLPVELKPRAGASCRICKSKSTFSWWLQIQIQIQQLLNKSINTIYIPWWMILLEIFSIDFKQTHIQHNFTWQSLLQLQMRVLIFNIP